MVTDSIQIDRWFDCLYNVLYKDAPTSELRDVLEERWGDAETWRFGARVLSELNPSILRNGDLSAWVRVNRLVVAHFYYELQKPPERLQHEDKPLPWVERMYQS